MKKLKLTAALKQTVRNTGQPRYLKSKGMEKILRVIRSST